MSLANLLSMSLVLIFLLPWVLFVATYDPKYALLGVAAPVVDLSTKVIKRIAGTRGVFGRPKGAYDCDIFCTNGAQTGGYGFPSGHMATSTFVLISLYLITKSPFSTFTLPISIIYIASVAWARYSKKCHNVVQIVAGVIYGAFVATIFAQILQFVS